MTLETAISELWLMLSFFTGFMAVVAFILGFFLASRW